MRPFFTDQQRSRDLHLVGIENAILDLLLRVQDDQVAEMGLTKGIMKLVDVAEQEDILNHVGDLEPNVEAGGSCANVLRAASLLGVRASYSSAVGPDDEGRLFELGLENSGVANRVARIEGATGTSVVLVTPDGERTMNTHLGVCREYGPTHVPHYDVEHCRVFFTTGYIWDTPNQIEAIEDAVATARKGGAKLAIDLADPFAVERSKSHLERHFAQGFDVVFANAEEARIMTGLEPEAAAHELAKTIDIVAVKDGPRGAFVGSGDQIDHIPAHDVEVVDTTGAGDCFAAGFLYGLNCEHDLVTCGKIATLLAADNITNLGVRLSPNIRDEVSRIEASAE